MQAPFPPIRNRALEIMHKFLTEFGMTPAARSRISVSHAAEPARDGASSPCARVSRRARRFEVRTP